MNEILRDREHASIRLVMNPDRMVIREAQRTFTYLNLYGYLTDAVIVNRVFPDERRRRLLRRLARAPAGAARAVASGFAPVPVLTARYFDEEVIGDRDARPARRASCSTRTAPAAVLHAELTQELESENGRAVLRIPAAVRASAGRSGLKKVGPELIVLGRAAEANYHPPGRAGAPQPDRRQLEGSLDGSLEDIDLRESHDRRRPPDGRPPERAHHSSSSSSCARSAAAPRSCARPRPRSCAASGRRSSARPWSRCAR